MKPYLTVCWIKIHIATTVGHCISILVKFWEAKSVRKGMKARRRRKHFLTLFCYPRVMPLVWRNLANELPEGSERDPQRRRAGVGVWRRGIEVFLIQQYRRTTVPSFSKKDFNLSSSSTAAASVLEISFSFHFLIYLSALVDCHCGAFIEKMAAGNVLYSC